MCLGLFFVLKTTENSFSVIRATRCRALEAKHLLNSIGA